MPNSPYKMVTRARGITRTPTSRSATASDMRKKLVALCSFLSSETARMTRMFPPMVGTMTMMISRAAQFSSVPGAAAVGCELLLSSRAAAAPDMVLRRGQQALAWVEALIFLVLDTRSAWSLGSQKAKRTLGRAGQRVGLGEIKMKIRSSARKERQVGSSDVWSSSDDNPNTVGRWDGGRGHRFPRERLVLPSAAAKDGSGKRADISFIICLICLHNDTNRGRHLLLQMKSRLLLSPLLWKFNLACWKKRLSCCYSQLTHKWMCDNVIQIPKK